VTALVLTASGVPAGSPGAVTTEAKGSVLCDWFGVDCPEPDDTSPTSSPGPSDASPTPTDGVPGLDDEPADGAVDDAVEEIPDAVDGALDPDAATGPDAASDADGQGPGSDDEADEDGGPDEPTPPEVEGPPVTRGGHEDVDVFSVPGELRSEDLSMSGLRSVSIVSVPAATPSGSRLALKIVADHVRLDGFHLKTFADEGTAGTITDAEYVTLDGNATMYITSLRAGLPDGDRLVVDPDDPPTFTGWLLALLNPTIGFLGATSEQQVWAGFREQVWSD
jgi:hypothetical protein